MAARGMPSHCRCGSGLLPKLRVCLLGRKGPAPFHCGTRLPAEGSDGPGLYRQDCPPHPRTDRHSPELLGDARPREGYDREKSVSSGL